MNLMVPIFWGIPALLLFIFVAYSLMEGEKRAFFISLLILSAWSGIFLFLIWAFPGILWELTVILAGLLLILLFWMIFSPRPRETQAVIGPQKQIDERDIIFARFDLEKDSERYREYYNRRPERKEKDDRIREIPDILSPYHMEREPILFSLADAEFAFLDELLTLANGPVNSHSAGLTDAAANAVRIKQIFRYLGADRTGICKLDPAYIYSHVGRGPEPYGRSIQTDHKYAVVFTIPMDYAVIAMAPQAPVIVETARKYVEAARIAIIAADWIRRLGYPARAHMAGSNYHAVLPALAWKAGLGEVGRMSILMTPEHGPRVRLGLVTTTLPLNPDSIRNWGMQDFCRICQKCAVNCPSGAIPFGDKREENGSVRWIIDREACYEFWRKCGTDCSRCLSVCPYSKPPNALHNAVRFAAARSKAAQRLSLWGDHLFYGKRPKTREKKFHAAQ